MNLVIGIFLWIFCESSLHQLEFFLFLVHVIETDDVTKNLQWLGYTLQRISTGS